MDDLSGMKLHHRVTTDIPGKKGQFWDVHTRFCKPVESSRFACCLAGKINARRLASLQTAFRLFFQRAQTDAYVTSGTLVGISLAFLQTIFFQHRKPHVLIDCIWYESASRFRHFLFSVALRLVSPAVSRFVVWASHELEDYPRAFGIRKDKLAYVHFWHTLGSYNLVTQDEGYVFAGGNWDRDYPTVLDVARKLPDIPFRIGTTRPEQLAGYEIPRNVEVKGYSPQGFRQAIASCRVMLVPMVKGVLHSGGQQTVLNAMYLGKSTIAYGQRWACDLITNGVNGYVVDYEEVEGVVAILRKLWDDPELYAGIAQRAAAEAAAWPPARSMDFIYRMALGLHSEQALGPAPAASLAEDSPVRSAVQD